LITYTVTANYPGVTYSTMSYDLSYSISSNQFNTNLNKNAASQNATALIGCQSSTPSTAETNSVNTDDSSDDSKSLSDGAIAGIVIAVIFVVVLVAFGFYYFFLNKGPISTGDGVQTAQPAVEVSTSYKKKSTVDNQDNPVFGISAITSSKHQAQDDANM